MAGEIQVSYGTGKTVYSLIRNRVAQVWNTSSLAFEVYSSTNYSDYDISLVEQGTSSGFYVGTFPGSITAGVYSIVAKQQVGGSPAETDPVIAQGDFQWNGSVTLPLSDLATSGQIGQVAPIRIYRGEMLQNFPVYLVSSLDHITPFTSGIISGQISRDGGNLGPLQSGNFSEVGLGLYKVNLTSGDLLANTVALIFTGNGISGGTCDPRVMTIITQRTSGQT